MRAFVGAIVALALVAIAAPSLAAEQLPDVTVTAPSNAPLSTAPTNPYFGKTRVEEENWPQMPCDQSRIGAAVQGSCRRGPSTMNFEHGDSQGSRQQSNCQIAHDLVISRTDTLAFEADSLVFDPNYVSAIGHQRQDCYVEARRSTLQAQLVDMNRMTRQAANWGALAETADLATMEFTVDPYRCVAFEKRGPRWGGGFTYIIHASVCRKDGRPVETADIGIVLGLIQVRQRDSAGNLR